MTKPASAPVSTVYGPVPSRRLGFSLGIDLFSGKTCSFDCVYCQLGKSGKKTSVRREYVPAARVVEDVKQALAKGQRLDHITFSGSGEPTLHEGLGAIIKAIKKITKVPVAVLTNASLLGLKEVRDGLKSADVVVPSLDAALPPAWKKVNRPLPSLSLDAIVSGLATFKKSFKGQVWLEVMLVKGLNDKPEHIRALKKAIGRIKPDKVQLNTVTRPPAERSAAPLTMAELESVRRRLGGNTEVVVAFQDKKQTAGNRRLKEVLFGLIRRRPVTLEDMATALGESRDAVRINLGLLLQERRIVSTTHKDQVFYEAREE
jgi:wyosine [tRNA(Phe)-imidazoG37] synthetase (radical SAM superfamily)